MPRVLPFLFLAFTLSNAAFACKCRIFEESEIVLAFEGVALRTKVEARHRDRLFGPVMWKEGTTEFKVLRTLKGDVHDRIKVWHTIPGAVPPIGACDPEFGTGMRYKVHAARNGKGRLFTAECNYHSVRDESGP